jgi:hypothetical protein
MQIVVIAFSTLLISFLIWWWVSKWTGRGYTGRDAPWQPPAVHDNILTPAECDYIIKKADPLFTRSSVVGSASPSDARTSETAWIPKDDPVARKILERASQLTGKSMDNCESLQVVRYRPGSYYRAHHDSCCDDVQACRDFEGMSGQRVGTLLVYLNSEFTEGETHFPEHNDLKVKPPRGSGVFFRPLGENENKCHPKALHAGLPIKEGTKYVCNAWVREDKFIM